ncbi:HsdR family type I site-specific deoxyribonuclease [Pseudidiomarina sp. 1APP75-32.1]|uniref:Type I restriction enzyme endonuclease subunit n=1 Tax=Pseudidiomarina terrestris TaxID=2820060 RepID=A0AAW7R0J0_9GAMM|nr:HsdR family type I site-specific deoxyribonuclease [Pseudidiomarina sp. 1APP75-32.1]MDN7125211.1 HsdR family type I site-specific deoxyribonuclease [Pseudidiomarina sp. 1APP75-32.1]
MMKGRGTEWHFAEKPILEYLLTLGYEFAGKEQHPALRGSENQVIFRPHLIAALQRLNGISEQDAIAAAAELARKEDNEEWVEIMRGDFARNVEGQATQKTLKVIDFQNPSNNQLAVTQQLYVKAEKSRIPDVVLYVNGLPLVVIEAKSPINHKDKNGEAFDQLKQYERDIPRLFFTNLFNIVTDGTTVLYGATGAPSKFYGYWRDTHPREDNFDNELHKGLWSLLEPSRLLDILAHFVVFEREEGKVIKKIARYQQFRAVNKMVERVAEGKHKRGLIWHTQGSGKSLTMVFAALKLKHHRTVKIEKGQSSALANPNLLILTDRKDLDTQIANTFIATGLPNPTPIKSIKQLRELMSTSVDGQTLLSTIFKFEGSTRAIPNSENWIVMVDECHRTQEKDLGAALRATLPNATFFGFTGTPVKKNDKNTYENFGVVGEGYLDKYGIDDAVRDNATVPIRYTSRKTEWQIDEAKIDSLFDTWFADLSDEQLAQIKKRGVRLADLVRHPKRIELIAFDLWTHFKEYAKPDGFKAQLVAYDREAVVLYKQALDTLIASEYERQGMSKEDALRLSQEATACVYSKSQEDDKPSENKHKNEVREKLVTWYVDDTAEDELKRRFKLRHENPQILIVCDKLLTGFDAPAEAVMYLDKPLKEHTLLQAIARTNRVADAKKKQGLIVDYIGVSKHLDEALASYRAEDVQNAMRDLDGLRSELEAAQRELLVYVKGIKRIGKDVRAEYDALIKAIGTEDEWILFQRKVRNFVTLYEALAPDPCVIPMSYDLKWFANFLLFGKQVFEKKESFEQAEYSEKIRQMLEEHLHVTGLSTVVKLRSVIDGEFWDDFEDAEDESEEDKRAAALKKTTELRKITEAKLAENQHQYAKFSEKLKELIERMDDQQLSWGEKLKAAQEYAKQLDEEGKAYEGTGMSFEGHALLKVIEAIEGDDVDADTQRQLAETAEQLYSDTELAPTLWHTKEGLRKELRQRVRKAAHQLGFKKLKDLPSDIEDIAIKHFARGKYE